MLSYLTEQGLLICLFFFKRSCFCIYWFLYQIDTINLQIFICFSYLVLLFCCFFYLIFSACLFFLFYYRTYREKEKMEYDLVFLNGRVIDPETNFDAIRSIGIIDGLIVAISEEILKGKIEFDISNLVLCPGFIDVHSHEHTDEYYALKCQDGVTSVFELEVGTNDIDQWYAERENRTVVNHGVAIGHIQVRMKVFNHPPGFLPQSDSPAALQPDRIDQVKEEIEYGLQRGAMAMGFGIHYVPAATRWEIVECFSFSKKI